MQTVPAHSPCSSTLAPGDSLEILPHLGWCNPVANGLPSANVAFPDGASYVIYDGAGYHDQNWSDEPLYRSTRDWYWGHLLLGPVSVVFFSGNSPANQTLNIAEVALNGEVLLASCQPGSLTATPTLGSGGEGSLQHLSLQIPLGTNATLEMDFLPVHVLTSKPNYTPYYQYYKWAGSVTGGIVGGQQYQEGVSIVERFAPLTSS